jgi:hypothetical protein
MVQTEGLALLDGRTPPLEEALSPIPDLMELLSSLDDMIEALTSSLPLLRFWAHAGLAKLGL